MRKYRYKKKYFREHFKGSYQSEQENPTNWKKIQEIKALGYTKGKLLDIGCAYGFFLARAEKLGFKTYGIDISTYALSQARKNTRAKLFRLDLSKDVIPISGIDVCVLLNTLEHIPNYLHTLKEIRKSLSKNGLLFIFVPTGNRWLTDETHVNYFTTQSLRLLLEQLGFKIIRIGEEGGKLQIPLGILHFVLTGNTNFNFVPEKTGSFISCYAVKG